MRECDFKKYSTELRNALDNTDSMTTIDAIIKSIDTDFRKGKLTNRQYDLMCSAWNSRYNELWSKNVICL